MAEQQYPTKPKLKPTPKNPTQTPESNYWKSFKPTQLPNLIHSITSITFSPNPPHLFAATHSSSLTLHHPQTLETKSTISHFKDVAYSPSFRCDGSLIAAGGESGVIQVFDVKTRTPLRHLRGHARAVRLVKYPNFDKLHLFSGGDDGVVKYWDVATETKLFDLLGHRDYVRCGSGSVVNSGLFVTGSYDHKIKVWDVRVSGASSAMEINHGKPVEDVIFLPSGGLIASAGGNSVKIWDVIGGGKLVCSMESHNKTVTSICVGKIGKDNGEESEQFRVLSVSLDGYMKVFDYSNMKVTHSMRYPAPLLSIGVSPDGFTRAIGTSNGIIFGGKRKKKVEKDVPSDLGVFSGFGSLVEPQTRVLRPTNFRYFHRSQSEKPSKGDYLVERPKKVKVAAWDRLLQKFRHKEALVSAMHHKNPENLVAVMEELVARKKLMKCVSNLDLDELHLLLLFLQKHTTMPRHAGLLIGFAKKVISMRAEDIGESDELRRCVLNLKRAVEEEIRAQHSMLEIQGIISPLLRMTARI